MPTTAEPSPLEGVDRKETHGKGFQLYAMSGAGSLIVEFLLTLAKQDYHRRFPSPEERQTKAFKALSPTGQIPVLITPEGHHLAESLAITVYLLNRFPATGMIAPMDTAAHGACLQWLGYLATTLYPANQRYYQTSRFDGDQEAIRQSGWKDRRHCYALIAAEGDGFLAGDAISAADLYLYMLLRWDRDLDAVLADHPRLDQIVRAVDAVPAVQHVLAQQPAK